MNIKKELIIIVAIVLLAGMFVLTGCDIEKTDVEIVNNLGDSTADTKTESTASIVGNWKYESGAMSGAIDLYYTFNADGTGKYDAAGTLMEFTYTIDRNNISILYKDNTTPFKTEYEINANTLNAKDSMGSDTLYKKID